MVGDWWPGDYSDGAVVCAECGQPIAKGEPYGVFYDEEVDDELPEHIACAEKRRPGWLEELRPHYDREHPGYLPF